MGGCFIEPLMSAGGRIGAGQINGTEPGPELPLVLPADIGLLVGHDAGLNQAVDRSDARIFLPELN